MSKFQMFASLATIFFFIFLIQIEMKQLSAKRRDFHHYFHNR